MSAHLRLDSSSNFLPPGLHRSRDSSEDLGHVVSTVGLCEEATCLTVTRPSPTASWTPKILYSYVLCLAKHVPRRNRLGGRRVDPQLPFEVYPPNRSPKTGTPTSETPPVHHQLLLTRRPSRRPAPSLESDNTCKTFVLNSWPNGFSQRKSEYCKRNRAGLSNRSTKTGAAKLAASLLRRKLDRLLCRGPRS